MRLRLIFPVLPVLVIGILSLSTILGCGGNSNDSDDSNPQSIVEQYIAALSDGDIHAAAECWGVEPDQLNRAVGSGIHTVFYIVEIEMTPTSEFSAIVLADYVDMDQADGVITSEDHFSYKYDLVKIDDHWIIQRETPVVD